MSTVFLGTSDFAVTILERLAARAQHRPSLVLTRPDRPRGRGRRLASPPVAERARALGLALEQPDNVNDERDARARSPPPSRDAVVVCAFGALIKEPLLSAQELLNVHPSLLPRWRGAAPIERAIMAGDADSGVSIIRLTAGLDSGPICLAGSEPIAEHDTYGSLAPRLAQLGADLLLAALDRKGADGTLEFAEQDELGVTYAEKIAPEDRLLDPSRSATELERVVRALSPHIGARVQLPDASLMGVHEAAVAEPADGDGDRPSGVFERDGHLLLACEGGSLELLLVQPPGGRAMDAGAYLRGRGLPGPGIAASGRRQRCARGQTRVGLRLAGLADKRYDAGPHRQLVVLLVVHRRPCAGLRRGLVDRQREHRRRLQLVLRRRARLGPATGHDVLDDRLQRRSLLLGRVDRPRRSQQHDRAVVGRVVHRRAREHEAVEQRHGQACRRAGAERAQRAARRSSRAGTPDRRCARAAWGSRTAGRSRRRCPDARSAPRRESRRSSRARGCRVRACAAGARAR